MTESPAAAGGGIFPRRFLFVMALLMAAAVGGGVAVGLRLKGRGLGGLSGLIGGGYCAQAGVAGVVNGQAVPEADIDLEMAIQQVLRAQLGQPISPDPAQLAMYRRELASQVVDQTLLQGAALQAGHSGDPADLARLLQPFNMDPASFAAKLTALGITAERLDRWTLRQSANSRYVESLGQTGLTPENQAEKLFPSADIQYCVDGRSIRPVQVGRPAPDFELQGVDGQMHKLSEYRGKAVMLNFWATWCTPCKIEMPHLSNTQQAFQQQLTVLGVSSEEQPATVTAFLGQNPLPFPILVDQTGDISRQYRVEGLPTTFFIGPDGTVLEQNRGAFLTPAQLQPYVDRLLATVKP